MCDHIKILFKIAMLPAIWGAVSDENDQQLLTASMKFCPSFRLTIVQQATQKMMQPAPVHLKER